MGHHLNAIQVLLVLYKELNKTSQKFIWKAKGKGVREKLAVQNELGWNKRWNDKKSKIKRAHTSGRHSVGHPQVTRVGSPWHPVYACTSHGHPQEHVQRGSWEWFGTFLDLVISKFCLCLGQFYQSQSFPSFSGWFNSYLFISYRTLAVYSLRNILLHGMQHFYTLSKGRKAS